MLLQFCIKALALHAIRVRRTSSLLSSYLNALGGFKVETATSLQICIYYSPHAFAFSYGSLLHTEKHSRFVIARSRNTTLKTEGCVHRERRDQWSFRGRSITRNGKRSSLLSPLQNNSAIVSQWRRMYSICIARFCCVLQNTFFSHYNKYMFTFFLWILMKDINEADVKTFQKKVYRV